MNTNNSKFANLKTRFTAGFIDAALLTVVNMLIIILANQSLSNLIKANGLMLYNIIYFAYIAFCLSSKFQATIGQKIVGIKVIDKDSDYLTLSRILKLACAYVIVATIANFLSLGVMSHYKVADVDTYFAPNNMFNDIIVNLITASCYLTVIFTKEKTSLYDIVCGTRIINHEYISVSSDYKISGLFRRLFTFLIDMLICMMPSIIIALSSNTNLYQALVLFIIVNVIYYILMPLTSWKGTIGMKILDTSISGNISARSSAMRYLLSPLYLVPISVMFFNHYSYRLDNLQTVDAHTVKPFIILGTILVVIISWSLTNLFLVALTKEKAMLNDIFTKMRVIVKRKDNKELV